VLRSPTEWFSDSLCVGLGPDQIDIAYRRRGWRQADTLHSSMSIAHPEPRSATWLAALDELDRWLLVTKPQHTTARVVLSNRLARVALMPWSDKSISVAEEDLVARACLDAHYEHNEAWSIRIDQPTFGASRLVVGIETELLDAIREVFSRRRLYCEFVLPAFVAAWNRWGSALKASEAAFAMAESDALLMATRRRDQWHSVRVVRMNSSDDALVDTLRREPMLQGFASEPPIWFVGDVAAPALAKIPGLTVLAPTAISTGALLANLGERS
jgi:hypothetical protein